MGQLVYQRAIDRATVVVCTGPAGTGKTMLACWAAYQALRQGKVKKVVLSRPIVPCGQGLGWLPGDVREKINPYVRPLLDTMSTFMTRKVVERHILDGVIELWPLETMRGSTLENAFVCLDEAQNADYGQLRMLLTRLGRNSKFVVTGDASQVDLTSQRGNPLRQVIDRLAVNCHEDVSIVELTRRDIVRHELVQWLDARLGDDPEGVWYDFTCPCCQKTCWFDNGPDDEYDVQFARCWGCTRNILLPDDLDSGSCTPTDRATFADATFPRPR